MTIKEAAGIVASALDGQGFEVKLMGEDHRGPARIEVTRSRKRRPQGKRRHLCSAGCGYPVAEPGLCGECACEDDCG